VGAAFGARCAFALPSALRHDAPNVAPTAKEVEMNLRRTAIVVGAVAAVVALWGSVDAFAAPGPTGRAKSAPVPRVLPVPPSTPVTASSVLLLGDDAMSASWADAPRARVKATAASGAKNAVTWWDARMQRYAEARARYAASLPASGFVAGAPAPQRVPERAELDALIARLEDWSDAAARDVADDALLALARAGGAGKAVVRERALARFCAGSADGARTAALALCVADDTAARAALRWLVDADRSGDGGRSGAKVATADRAWAALALGAISDAADLERLLDLACTKSVDRDVRGLALVGLARLLELDAGAASKAVPRLIAMLDDGRDSRSVRALLPAVLVRSGDATAQRRVLTALREPTTIPEIRRSAAYALSALRVDPADADAAKLAGDVVAQWTRSAGEDADAAVRQWAALALGEWSLARPELARAMPELVEFHRRGVRGAGVAPEDVPSRLLSAAAYAGIDPAVRTELVVVLRACVGEALDPHVRAAAAQALALAGDPVAIDALRQRLGAEVDPDTTAAIVEALGWLRDAKSRPAIERLAVDGSSAPVRCAAMGAAALLAGPMTVTVLLDAFAAARDDAERGAAARALGAIADARALAPLQAIAADGSRPRGVRERAVLALGLLADPAVGASLAPLTRGFTGRDGPEAIVAWMAMERP
jgi:hypothetical protein